MKDKLNILYVIEKSPELMSAKELVDKINQNESDDNPITIYIKNEGILWLQNYNFQNVITQNEHIIFYANAKDAKHYKVAFQEGVIFSNSKILHQLLNWADQVYFIN